MNYQNLFTLFSPKTHFQPYSRKLHPKEVALAFSLMFGLLFTSYLTSEQEELAEGMIRLHVVAHSDSEQDQALKLVVRDEILAQSQDLFDISLSPQETEALFLEHISHLTEAGLSVSQGYDISVEVTDLWFPTKHYEDFSLPAGEYKALNVTIGEGEGENWWCVAYPPLCVGVASETIDVAVEAGNFSQNQQELMTQEGYILKFKSIELWEQWKHFFSKK